MSADPSEKESLDFSFLDPETDVGRISQPTRVQQPQADLMKKGLAALPKALKHLQFDSLRPGQDRAVFTLLSQRDTVCILPTGGGKSAIYILPAICMNWSVVVFSPLVSLIKDQVESLWKFRLPAGQISSGQTPTENHMTQLNWESGDTQFLLVAPERIEMDQFMGVMRKRKPNMVVIDEAHCMSQWGEGFRSSYSKIGDFIQLLKPDVVLAITATATEDVEADIRRLAGISNAAKVVYYPERKNLIVHTINGYNDSRMASMLIESDGPTVVYCATRRETERLFRNFKDVIKGGALVYHGGMTSDERTTNQNLFMSNHVRVMFATNAFGLGVNKPDIRGIIHRDTPGTVEALAQEQGRAGRDGLESNCTVFVDQQSFETAKWMINTSYPNESVIRQVFFKMKTLADKEGIFQMTIDDLAQSSGLHAKIAGSAVGILKAAKVIDRVDVDENPSKVRLIKDHPDDALQGYINLIRSVGLDRGDGTREFKMSMLLSAGKLKSRKTEDVLKALDQNGYIQYTRPFRGKTTKIIGDISLLDFAKVEKRRKLSLKKLLQVYDYTQVPDDQKHAYLREYFGVK